MSVSYTCPNPDCGVTLKTPNRVPTGKSVKCPKCGNPFVPEPAEAPGAAGAGTFKIADDEPKKSGAKPEANSAPPAPVKKPFHDDDEEDPESVKKGYGVVKETEEEVKAAKKNKPKFTEVQDKFKKSARGPAMALLVMPSNLLLGAGLILTALSIVFFISSMWPLVFNDAAPGEEELDEAVFGMMLAVIGFVWGAMVCYGASQTQELASYTWATIGGIMGVPMLVGIFSLIMLQNPKVKAGFEEAEAGPDEDDEDDIDKRRDEDDEDEDEDEDDEEGGGVSAGKKKKSTAQKVAGRLGRRLLGAILSGGDEEDDGGGDEEEPEEEEPAEEEEKDEADDSDEEDDEDKAKARSKTHEDEHEDDADEDEDDEDEE
jgi:hypothetical protein